MKPSDTRKLASVDINLSVLGLGCAQMGHLSKRTPLAEAKDAAEAAWDLGIRYFDTAPFYGFTRSERRLGTLLDDRVRDDFRVSTKVGRLMIPERVYRETDEGFAFPAPFVQAYDYSYDAILKSFEASQQRLGLAMIDILYVHDIGAMTHGDRHGHYWSQLTAGGGFRALSELRADGRIRAFGIGVNECDVLRNTLDECDMDVAMLAGRYTLLEQDSHDLLDRCLSHGTRIVVAGAFNSGVLAGNNSFNYGEAPPEILRRVLALREAASEFEIPIQAAALQFPLAHPAVVSVVVGARNADQITHNAAWLEMEIPASFWQSLSKKGLIVDGAPLPE
ncbi:aldo/keto reductase [Aureimonas pseudogalii]|uniref:D-threo-aldose 1-dehydrogenase n=1 Tax=Aureimonas pseudogalii TaxID=1744844 RepID=A0A7W6H939_9HYPH|nr:aldo/keto reductase [Aureimonas pseudogalii]MBB4000643.1 D-threo-aldose 1-dehydrogenase [Aureimonas pseudogalii]